MVWPLTLSSAYSALVMGTVLLSMSTLAELPATPSPALFDSHRQAIGVIMQVSARHRSTPRHGQKCKERHLSLSLYFFFSSVVPQLDFQNRVHWTYQRPIALPGSIVFTEPCEDLRRKMLEVSKKHCLCLWDEGKKNQSLLYTLTHPSNVLFFFFFYQHDRKWESFSLEQAFLLWQRMHFPPSAAWRRPPVAAWGPDGNIHSCRELAHLPTRGGALPAQ